jgi:ribosome recycling factor
MNPNQVIEDTKRKLDNTTSHFQEEAKKLRTGRAHPGMLDSVMVESYGQQMPLKAVAGIIAPEAQLLQITPFDPSNLQAIANAIRDDQSLGLTPTDDGRVVRITVPPLTAETRQAMVKILHQKVEEAMIAARGARHEAIRMFDQAEKDKDISRDERQRYEKQIDELLAKQKSEIESLAAAKEKDIVSV